jgi:hypothetical protein
MSLGHCECHECSPLNRCRKNDQLGVVGEPLGGEVTGAVTDRLFVMPVVGGTDDELLETEFP